MVHRLRVASRGAAVALFCVFVGCERKSASHLELGPPDAGTVSWTTFHGDRARRGWNANETVLTPDAVAGNSFGLQWESAPFDAYEGVPGRMYASPLYLEGLTIGAGPFAGRMLPVVFAATSNSDVYAYSALSSSGVPAGTLLWHTQVGTPAGGVDDLRIGILGTPVLDPALTPPRLYVAADTVDTGGRAWRVFALDASTGSILPGWPVVLSNDVLGSVNQNGPALFAPPGAVSQRGGLNLSPDGSLLYVPFGGYYDGAAGWLVAIDTRQAQVVSAFSGAPEPNPRANAGMWASAGVSVADDGSVYIVTGNSPSGVLPHTWGESVLRWAPGTPLRLVGAYTAWNHCQLDAADIDLCGSGLVLLPERSGAAVSHLLATGGKQGNAYLIDADGMSTQLDGRPACNWLGPGDEPPDTSLWDSATPRTYYGGTPGPLNVFGPYSDTDDRGLQAKARSTPAWFRGADGTDYLLYTGTTRDAATNLVPQPPGFARLRIVTGPSGKPFLQVDALENTLVFQNPGSPVVSSDGTQNAIAWIVDPNVNRSASLLTAPPASLYAVDLMSMRVLYTSRPADLHPGGKYFHAIVARGTVFVGTDRVSGFGLAH